MTCRSGGKKTSRFRLPESTIPLVARRQEQQSLIYRMKIAVTDMQKYPKLRAWMRERLDEMDLKAVVSRLAGKPLAPAPEPASTKGVIDLAARRTQV
mgnify:CR=1 FL=1